MQSQQIHWKRFESTAELRQCARDEILACADQAIRERGKFLIVLAGGTTPRDIYLLLRDSMTDWSKWHVYFGDERCLPPDHADRNSRMAEESLLQHAAIPAAQIHPIPAELGPDAAAEAYSLTLKDVGLFDLVLLGMGEDAHTASLFPGLAWETDPVMPAIPVRHAPKPPADRVSLSASRLSAARRVVFLVTGAGKRDAVRLWEEGIAMPVAAIRPESGVEVFLDAAAEPRA
jgi:6-phosphogluconolactonase